MKNIASCMIFLFLATGCSDNTPDATTETTPASPANEAVIPSQIESKFDKIIADFEHQISSKFWTDFTSTTRRGGEGTTEKTFDQNAFEKFMEKKGFAKIPNTDMDFKGMVDSVDVSISHQTVSGEHGGWIHNWTIDVQKSGNPLFKKQRKFESKPG